MYGPAAGPALRRVAAADSVALAALIQPFDGLVGRCHQRDRLGFGAARRPPGDGGALHLIDGAAAEPAVGVVVVRDRHVAAAQAEAGGAFPFVFEAVDTLELDRAERVDKQPEHAAPADGGELEWVADERDPPALHVGELCQLGELRGRDHARLVDDHRRADR